MNKLRADKISFNNEDFIVEINSIEEETLDKEPLQVEKEEEEERKEEITQAELIINRAKDTAVKIIEKANLKAKNTIEKTNIEIQELKEKAIDEAKKEAESIIQKATSEADKTKQEAEVLLEDSKAELEKLRAEKAKEGYEEGFKDALEKASEECQEKIAQFDNFCSIQKEIKEKILKAASMDILNIIQCISKKVILKNIDANVLIDIINNTIELFDKKDNIEVILSENYYNLISETNPAKNFNLICNKDLKEDTILIGNEFENYCADVEKSIDSIINDINRISKGNIEAEMYLKDNEDN